MSDSILLVAGETSGDILAAHVVQGMRKLGCQLPIWGIGGANLMSTGMECIASVDELAVRGYTEVLAELPRLWYLRKRLVSMAASRRPKLCITVDAPDFNLGLALKMKALGIPTLHFISPSIWAWRAHRLASIRKAVDHMVCIFPFEPAIYHEAGVPASYVGHPMAQMIPLQINHSSAKQKLNLNPALKTVALLPGSRAAEIEYILPRLLHCAIQMLVNEPNVQFVLPIASAALKPNVERWIHHLAKDLPLLCVDGQADTVLAAADVGIIASGTATLQAALYKLPMVITYVMPKSSYFLMQGKGYQPWVGLPNILCQSFVVPEYIQDKATPQALANVAIELLNDSNKRDAIQHKFTELHQVLRCDTQTLAARAVLRML